jgi:hypothetical protein
MTFPSHGHCGVHNGSRNQPLTQRNPSSLTPLLPSNFNSVYHISMQYYETEKQWLRTPSP